ncbi:helix-turn-helix domain-containing protein [Haloarculaceae archaeon H-GB1-1]|nr:helix-turn-helix domain-containing protein [Haloarculaceae archaeon H-GB1-1]
MITAKVKIKYAGDWVDDIGRYDVQCLGIASTFRNRGFVGITALDCAADEFEDVVETIRENQYVRETEVLETHESDGRILATISTHCEYTTYTPMKMIRMEGFLPIGYSEYRDGFEYLEILAEDREHVSRVIEALDFEVVEIVRIVSDFRQGVGFSLLEWQQLVETISPDERELLHLAVDSDYYDIPSGISLDDLAEEAGIAKSTASRRLRNVEGEVMPVITKYIQLYSKT